jgi:tetratricopeptide (TPR) repeat protein
VATRDEFSASFRAGDVIFFTGAGVSWDSGAVMPPAILKASAELFLPDPRHYPEVREVLDARGVAGLPLDGIQPEVFYENLLMVVDDPAALQLWRVLSPLWLESRGAQLQPNINHFAIVTYAARHKLPIFTMNFDVLFERAAEELGVSLEPVVIVPGHGSSILDKDSNGTPRLYKLHGSIMVEGREALGSLGTTMQAISSVNQPMLNFIEQLGDRHALAFVGYSGCDIDYFPLLADKGFHNVPFWFNPLRDPITEAHARRAGARIIYDYPSDILSRLEPGFPSPLRLNSELLLEDLRDAVSLRLTAEQKLYFLALCLHSIGRNEAAQRILAKLDAQSSALPAENRIGALLLRSRVEDCRSEYWKAAASASSALRESDLAYRNGQIDRTELTAYRARALYHRGMALQQQMGPSIGYGDKRVDWRPGLGSLVRGLLQGGLLSMRLGRARRKLDRSIGVASRVEFIRAQHVINDHAVMFLGRIGTIFEGTGLIRLRLIRAELVRRIARMLKRASTSGDYFCYGHAHKYLNRWGRAGSPVNATEAYGLLRDPLNYALVCRDLGVQKLQGGDARGAANAFREALNASLACGSRATALKSLAGLLATDTLTDADRKKLRDLAPGPEGAGYRKYWAERIAVLLD